MRGRHRRGGLVAAVVSADRKVGASVSPTSPDAARWRALWFVCLGQLMVTFNGTIVNIALPSAQADLGISDGNRQWVITAYTIVFGGLLLLGGRIADLWGRKRTLVTGLAGFGLAPLVGGAAQSEAVLYSARAVQGLFGALLLPSALSLLAVMFTEPRERARAFGVYGAVAGSGGAIGLLAGGVLTEYLTWRWTFFVNAVVAAVAVAGVCRFVREPSGGRNPSPLDLPGVALATGGVASVVYGFTRAESGGWTDAVTLTAFAASVLLLAAFVLLETRVRAPLLPLRVVADRTRGGVYLALVLAFITLFGAFLFLTYYLQVVREYSAIATGLAFLPMAAGMIAGSTQIAPRLLARVPARLVLGPAYLCGGAGMLALTRLETDSSYAGLVLPAEVLIGLGLGMAFMPSMSLATYRVAPRDAGVASAMANTAQQMGAAIGTALLNTIAAGATDRYLADHAAEAGGPARREALVHGYTTALWWAAGMMALAALLAFTLVSAGRGGAGAAPPAQAAEGRAERGPPPA
ncbi:MFS transporter, partial [Streptomyces sp. 6N223]|uniref:MFS transporter n=1 Tax=Streptomyces sp. 6N223 TaxID=3457412 RepID=UPI003FCFED49